MLWVEGLEFEVQGSGFWVSVCGLAFGGLASICGGGVEGLGCWVGGLSFRVDGLGFKV